MSIAQQNTEEQEEPTNKRFKTCRVSFSNPVVVEAIEEHFRKTGMSEKELAREAILEYLEEEDYLFLEME